MTDPKSNESIPVIVDAPVTGVGETMAADSLGSLAPPSAVNVSGVLAPQRLAGRYDVLGLLGAGGMGTVYRARDVELDEVVALKVLRRELVDSPPMLARFRQEAKLARRVTHRNVARTFDIGEHAGEKFLTMEYVDGESLASLVSRRGRLPVAEAVRIAREVCAGMAAAHAAGVVHRDLKPENVLIASDGRVVVTDFGIARASADASGAARTQGGIVGTPAYMAPEQVEAHPDIDARADVYALGAMVYELLTGVRAWPGDSPYVVAAARLTQPPPDPRVVLPSLPLAVAEVVLRCMARAKDARFASADDVAAGFAAAAPAVGSPEPEATPTGALPATPPRPRVAPADETSDKTIAVLPFKNGGAPDDAYLADGLTDDLIDILSMTPGLKVRPRSAVAHLRGTDRDPRQVGEELGVQVVVEGSVRKTSTNIRVSARLVSAADGFQLWARRFDRPAADVLAVNDEAANAIAQALTVSATARARVAPTDPVAVDLYLRATHEFHKFWRSDVLRSVDLFDQALARAPNDPTILAASARALVRAAFFGGDGAKAMLARARIAAERAVEGAPEVGESWVALASARMMAGDAPGAARAVTTALEKARGLASAHDLLGRILIEVGLHDEAVRHLRVTLSIDPSAFQPRLEIARALALMGNWADADALLDVPVLDEPARIARYLFRARLCLWRGAPHPDLENAPRLGPEVGVLADPVPLFELLRTRELTDALREQLERSAQAGEAGSRRRVLLYQINTEVLAFVFEVDQSLACLEHAIEDGLLDVHWLDRAPVLEPVRKDPRFAALRDVVAARAALVVAALTGA